MWKTLALALLAAGCGTTSEAAPTAKAQSTGTPQLQTLCVQTMTRLRTCTDDYIPRLVDARARLDKPAGIAAKVAADRDGVIVQAKAEWAQDSTDEGIAQMCQHMVAAGADPGDAEATQACQTQPDCVGFDNCIAPIFEKHLSK
jgi:hypothetical protein